MNYLQFESSEQGQSNKHSKKCFSKLQIADHLPNNHLKYKLQMQVQEADPRLAEWGSFSGKDQKSNFLTAFPTDSPSH